jgi:hypothetical protein
MERSLEGVILLSIRFNILEIHVSNIRFFLKFGPDFKKWISVLYKIAELGVLQNGIFSRFFDIGRGCKQGDPVSPYIFNLCVEIMEHMIRQNINIKGIKLGKEEVRLLQYTDDTVIFLDGLERSGTNGKLFLLNYCEF